MITSRPHGLGPFMTRVSRLAKESGNVFNLQEFEQNKIPLKQSFEDSIDTFLSLFDADMDEYFSAWFPLLSCVLPGLAHHANNFVRGVYHGHSHSQNFQRKFEILVKQTILSHQDWPLFL